METTRGIVDWAPGLPALLRLPKGDTRPIITVTNDILRKLDNAGRDLEEFSLDTEMMVREAVLKARYRL